MAAMGKKPRNRGFFKSVAAVAAYLIGSSSINSRTNRGGGAP